MRAIRLLVFGFLIAWCAGMRAQDGTASLHVRVAVQHSAKADNPSDNSGVVIWLTPLSSKGPSRAVVPQQGFRLVQKNKRFEPHMIVVPVGSTVDFPNQDPFFHNVFSLYKGKRFDLGFYEAGSSRSVRFDRPGVSFIFCNIHPEMNAVVLALETNDYAISNSTGEAEISHLTPGKYRVNFWFQNSSPELLAALSREIDVAGNVRIDNVVVPEVTVSMTHKNKFGQDYEIKSTY